MKMNKSATTMLTFIACIIALVYCVNSRPERGSDFKLFDVYRNYTKDDSNLLCTVLAYLVFSVLIIAFVLYLVFTVSNN